MVFLAQSTARVYIRVENKLGEVKPLIALGFLQEGDLYFTVPNRVDAWPVKAYD